LPLSGAHVVANNDPGSLARSESRAGGNGNPTPSDGLVLVADDSEEDRFFLLRAFAQSGIRNPVLTVNSGAEVVAYMGGDGKYADREKYPLPRIVFLDMQMPTPNGVEVLRWKQTRTDLPRILWVAMSNFNSVRTINDAYNAGATTFLTKPLEAEDIRNLVEAFEEYWLRAAPK
jgi:CheY-like chemotaxis protein